MAFRVETTQAAERDAESILEWLASEQAGETGWRWFARLQTAIHSLAEIASALPDRARKRTVPFRGSAIAVRPQTERVPHSVSNRRRHGLHCRHPTWPTETNIVVILERFPWIAPERAQFPFQQLQRGPSVHKRLPR
jgi:plasmid stabilization system protein ParE